MMRVEVTCSDWPAPRRFTFGHAQVWIGSGDDDHVSLTGPTIRRHHALAHLQYGRVDLTARGGLHVNGLAVVGGLEIDPVDQVQIGPYVLRFEAIAADRVDAYPRYVTADPVEQALLDAVARGDDASRVVYADWLDQGGQLSRAEFLRLQDELRAARPGDARLEDATRRLAGLAAQIDLGWRLSVATRDVEACGLAFDVPCPKQWSAMQPTDRDHVRHCTTCDKDVYYAISVGEARAHARLGRCVALDATVARWPGDLAPPYRTRVCEQCGVDIGQAYDKASCPSCGHVPAEVRMVGRLGMIATY